MRRPPSWPCGPALARSLRLACHGTRGAGYNRAADQLPRGCDSRRRPRTGRSGRGHRGLWRVPGPGSNGPGTLTRWQAWCARSGAAAAGLVRAENRIHGPDQHSCSPGGRPVMITDHVPAVLLPPDHADRRVVAAVPAGGCVEDRRDPDPAPPARGPAAPVGGPPEAGVDGPRAARGPGGRDTEGTPPGAAAAGHAGHDPALAPRHRPPPLGHQVHSRQDRSAGDTAEHQGPGPPART
jgi:hypothetical protein